MDDKDGEFFFFELINVIEKELSEKEKQKKVMIEKAINMKLLCDYAISCSYGDVVLIICMLHDYIKTLDKVKGEDIQYQEYYRKKFENMANRLAEQIEYDYDAAVEKCKKKLQKQEKENDIGEEALTLALKKRGEKSKNNFDNEKKKEGE